MTVTHPLLDNATRTELETSGAAVARGVLTATDLELLDDALLHNPALAATDQGDGYAIDNGLARDDDRITSFIFDGPPARLAREVLGDDAEFLTERVFTVRAGSHTTTLWHQDAPLTGAPHDHELCVVWIPLIDVGVADAPLLFAPGSHLERTATYSQGLAQNVAGFRRREGYSPVVIADDPEAVPHRRALPARRGDIVVLDGWTLHCSGPNRGPVDRSAFALRYRRVIR